VGRASKVASSQAGKGLLTQDDLDGYKTRELAPAECDYRGRVLMTRDGLLSASTTVIPREGGVSSTPRLLRISLLSLGYWIARLRGQ
jgi:hypothetical protein